MSDERERPQDTALLPRNFTLGAADRVRALVAGPPAYALRKRRIEDLEAEIVRFIGALEAKTKEPIDPVAPPTRIVRSYERLAELIAAHNRYYPIEANLAVDVRTGEL